jgi:hypothetical protein
MRRTLLLLLAYCAFVPAVCRAGDFQPDPRAVQRFGPAYRYPQAGWIVLHIEGEPYDRGVQHGRLLAPEIAAHVRCFAATQSPKSPADGWKQTRTLTNALFLRRYDKEYLEEMKGIADGASAAGARFDGRAIDLVDVVALNAWPEIMTLDSALEATPTGLEGLKLKAEMPRPAAADQPMRCSAFAATGPATKDGKIVFGHITMFSLYPSSFYNVWLDVKPAKGHRVLMQTYPSGIQSGLDYYMNDAGILVSETTLRQTNFDVKGQALASRIRKALQYGDTIDKVVEILEKDNNGLYTNEWLIGDTKTNEIAMFELGTHKTKLYRSSKNEWFGGTEGFYWGCNNTKDLEVRLETIPGVEDRPASMVFRPSDRDKTWVKLYDKYKGKIDADFGKLAFTTPPLAAYHSVDAKFTTTDMAKELKTWALFGPPLGRTWQPTFDEKQRFPEIQPLVGNPWAILTANAPPATKADGPAVVDLHNPEGGSRFGPNTVGNTGTNSDNSGALAVDRELGPVPGVVWHGTLLPKTDADTWLATAFANYERIVAQEKGIGGGRGRRGGGGRPGGGSPASDRDSLLVALFAYRSDYEFGCRTGTETPLSKTQSDVRTDSWHRVASGKGVLLLNELRSEIGAETFDKMMDNFGRDNAGKAVTAAQFKAFAEKAAGKKFDDFFDTWLNKTGLPSTKTEIGSAKSIFSVQSFSNEEEDTLIVYGTLDEQNTNREAAEALQQAIRERHSNYTVPIKTDAAVSEEDLKTHHVVLIGRPDTNRVVAKFGDALPIKFGKQSFVVRNEAYANAESGVIAAAENPLNKRYSVVVAAGLNAASTLRTVPRLARFNQSAEVVVFPKNGMPRNLVMLGKPAEPRAGE